jgi:putative DNA primase/helicase
MSAVADFIGAMEAAGVKPAEPIASDLTAGSLVRFRVHGDRAGRRNGWAVLHLDGHPAGAFGSYRLGVSERWRADGAERLTPAERCQQRARWAAVQAERVAEIERGWALAAARAQSMIADAGAAGPDHPYLIAKHIVGEGIYQRGDMLMVPMADGGGVVWNVQMIFADGAKRFLRGGRTDGLLWRVGDPDAVICIGEGVATMARVRKATGHAVVAAFSAKNLEPVARIIAADLPDLDHVICADDDAHLVDHPTIQRNLGRDAAIAAAAAIGGRVAMPPRSAD